MKEILIFSELTPDFKITNVVLELASKAKELAQKLDNTKLCAVIVNKNANYDEINSTLSKYGFDKVYILKNDCYSRYSTTYYTEAICNLINEIKPEIMLFGATRLGRDLTPRVAARLGFGLTADCTELDINENGQLAATRPTFGGSLMATILSKSQTQMATVRPNVFKSIPVENSTQIEVEEKFYNHDEINNLVEILDFKPFEENNGQNIADAKIVVAGGMGMKNKEGFELLKELADILGGHVGASRKAVEAGLADETVQIGQTGKTVTPKLYIACGISGAIQHLVGMNMSDKIIAINSDSNAPIFKNADYGIVGDVFDILPKIITKLK